MSGQTGTRFLTGLFLTMALWSVIPVTGFTEGLSTTNDISHLEKGLASGSIVEQMRAVSILERSKSASAITALANALQLSNSLVHRRASEALANKIFEFPFNTQLMHTLVGALNNPDPVVRHYALQGLLSVDNPQTTQGLIQALKSADKDVQLQAVQGLNSRSGPDVTKALLVAERSGPEEVRQAAAMALKTKQLPPSRANLLRAY